MADEVEKSVKVFLNIHLVGKRFKIASEGNQRTIATTLCENLSWDGEKCDGTGKNHIISSQKPIKSQTGSLSLSLFGIYTILSLLQT